MPRFYLPPAECSGDVLTLTGREAHHALRVLRLQPGDDATVLDGAGNEFTCKVGDVARDTLRLKVKTRLSVPRSSWQLTLLQALPKGKLINSIIEKATEIGATRVVPLVTERVVAQLDDDRAASKLEHWQHTALEAIKQCGTPWLPRIEPATTPGEFLARKEPFDLPLIASLQPGSRHPRECFTEFRQKHSHAPATVCCWVGPEGDFTPEEIALMTGAGALPITLGPHVLRSDTAAIYCLSVLSYELQARPA